MHTGTPTEPACFLSFLPCPPLANPKSHRYEIQYPDYVCGTVGMEKGHTELQGDWQCSLQLNSGLTDVHFVIVKSYLYVTHTLVCVIYFNYKSKCFVVAPTLWKNQWKSLCQRRVVLWIPSFRRCSTVLPLFTPSEQSRHEGRITWLRVGLGGLSCRQTQLITPQRRPTPRTSTLQKEPGLTVLSWTPGLPVRLLKSLVPQGSLSNQP